MHGVGDNDRPPNRLAVGKLRGLEDRGGGQSSSRPFVSWSVLSRQLHRKKSFPRLAGGSDRWSGAGYRQADGSGKQRTADRGWKKSRSRLARGPDRQSGTGSRLAEGNGRCSRLDSNRGMEIKSSSGSVQRADQGRNSRPGLCTVDTGC